MSMAKRVMNGTFGEVWLDGDKVAECTGAQAKIALKKEAVPQCGEFFEDTKVLGANGTGSLKMNKVFTRMAEKLKPVMKENRDVRFTVILKLADPDAYGPERVSLNNVSFDDLLLADWAAGARGEIEAPFTFTSYDYIDSVSIS